MERGREGIREEGWEISSEEGNIDKQRGKMRIRDITTDQPV